MQKQASQLDPLNEETWVELARSYVGVRKFDLAYPAFNQALKVVPHDSYILSQKAEAYLAAGDLVTAWQTVKDVKFTMEPRGAGTYVNLLIFQRLFDDAIAFISSGIAQEKEMPPLFVALAHSELGILHQLKGEPAQAQPLLLQAEGELKALSERDQGILLSETLLAVEAGLGRRDEVERLAKHNLKIVGRDQWQLPYEKECIARAYVALGDLDHALPLLSDALQAPCVIPLTPAHLRFDPLYDSWRKDPRFQKLAGGQ